MIPFQRHILANGLRLIVHEDTSTPLAAVNVLYNVGARDETPPRTGLAHLFEHFMFCGSKNIADFDTPLLRIGAYSNAYTSQDHTHFYEILPANNLETALWLESDRMNDLAFEQSSLATQKQVVIEEFKEVKLNRPFGDLWEIFCNLVYEKYPYKWLPIGQDIAHIEAVTMDIARDFFYQFYRPDNAIIVIGGNVRTSEIVPLVEKWFGDIPSGNAVPKNFPTEPEQTTAKKLSVKRGVPYPMLVKGWKMPARQHPDFVAYDLLTDLFGSGQSSYLYQKFVLEKRLFTDISVTVSGTAGPGVVTLIARPADGISLEAANDQLNAFFYHDFSFDERLSYDLQKVKNKNEAALLNNEIKLDGRTSILAVSESISRIEDFENDDAAYRAVTEAQIQRIYTNTIQPEKENTLFYEALDS